MLIFSKLTVINLNFLTMKKLLILGLALTTSAIFAQDLPKNPETGKCYVRCKTPDVYENKEVTVEVSPAYRKISVSPTKYGKEVVEVIINEGGQRLEVVPAVYEVQDFTVQTSAPSQRLRKIAGSSNVVTESLVIDAGGQRLEVVPAVYETRDVVVTVKEAAQRLEVVPAVYEMQDVVVVVQEASSRLKVIPAVYETRSETVVVKEASQRLTVVPAKYGTEKVTYKKREYGNSLSVVPAKFSTDTEVIEVKPASAQWQMGDRAPDCASSDPADCRYWCYKEIPAVFTTVRKTILESDAQVVSTPDCVEGSGAKNNCGESTYTKTVMLTPPTTKVIDIPAVTKTIKTTVMVTPPSTTVTEIPAITKTLKKKVMVTPPSTRVIDIPAITKVVKQTVMVTPPTTRVIDIPSKTKTYKKTVFTPASTEVVEIPGVTKTLKRTVMVTPPTTRVVDIAKKMGAVTKTIIASPAVSNETVVEAKYKTFTKEMLVKKGGLTEWKEVECKLLEYTDLGVKWNLGSATLTPEAKAIINAKLMPVLKQNVGAKVEIASHTDSRGSASSNQVLSERRAQAVSNYLISKGINSSRLVSNGYGEARLTNRCADGVSCTEKEHRANRRTQFRIIDAGN